MPDKIVNVSNVDYMQLLYENDNISVYELDAIHLGENPNGFEIDEKCVEKSISSFANMPMYGVIDNQFNPLDGLHNDFMEHFREELPDRISRDRILPFGVVPESGLKNAKLVERDGHTYLRMQVVVWKKLLPHVSNILQRRDGNVKVSVEFSIDDKGPANDRGYVPIYKFTITAITALGEKFKEVMDGAKLKTVKFSYPDYFKECDENYFSFSEQKEHEIPEDVISEMRAGIYLRNKYGRGGTKQVYNSISSSVSTGKVIDSVVKDMQEYFAKNPEDPGEETSSSKYISFKIFGGESGRKWIEKFSYQEVNKDLNIVINNSKGAAIKTGEWSNPGKKLYEPLFESKDTGGLIREAYLVVEEGYEDAPSEKLKYPHHVVKENEELILSVPGVEAAFQRAKQMGIFSGGVKAHLLRHYKELGLSTEKFSELEDDDDDEGDEDELDDKKFAELEEKCGALETEKAEMAQRCAELEEKCAKLEEDMKCANDKISVYARKEDKEFNLNAIEEFAHCFDDVKLSELKKFAETASRDDMEVEIKNGVMKFAKGKKEEPASAKFSVNPFFDFTKPAERDEISGLDKIIRSSKTKVN